ncbi:AhpC/TSA family protein [Lutibacter agarilyticus]|uniref:AhpC/TSA family protein n=1 Tax=Lutibacter agarilyticus TaxID=1109740 RepID=A0A238VWP6_9FLAO|nr:TlpA disulfide reductase family protein [Lutibacter agarilyticus]SNR38755.1 AhpC/TSA family protein [Lutibacter agarilyticus]
MLKKLTIILFFIATIGQSQHTIKGTMSPVDADVTWVALYKIQGSKQNYVQNVPINNGVFEFKIPENASEGMYRLRYKMDNNSIVDFIYNNEDVELKFDPNKSIETLQFLTSEENIVYEDFLTKTYALQEQLDSLQYSYFNLTNANERLNSEELYKSTLVTYQKIQQEIETKAANKLALHYIKASRKYYNNALIESPQEYLNSLKSHFFDYIDFEDAYLQHSAIISESVLNYVLYLNVSDDSAVQSVLHKNAINEVMAKITENESLKAATLTTLLYSFAQDENVEIVDFLIADFYNKLPESVKNEKDIENILKSVKLAIGKKAPNFTWEEKGTTKSLYAIDKAKTYVLVFWSTSCSHCVVEVPDLYEYLKDKSNIHVIDVALEKDTLGFDVYNEKFKNWTNVFGEGKWENAIAKDYEIVSTPTYFILDANKNIIAKPDYITDVKAYFGN